VWPASVSREGTVSVRFDADDGAELSDAIALELPAYADLVPETMSTGGIVTKDAALEAIYLPKFADTEHGTLGVSVRSALVGSLAGELRWFEPWSPNHEEDTMSVASRVIGTIGVARMEKTNRYDARITTDIATIMGRQRPDGGFAWCTKPECTSDPNVTGWVLFALGEAHRDGRNVDTGVGSRATKFISTYIDRPNATVNATDPHHDQDALLIAALAAAGGPTAQTMAQAQFEQYRAQLANWGRAYLVNALLDGGSKPDDPPVRTLLNDLAAATIPSANGNHWEDATTSSKYSFMTSTSTTALVALSIARAMPEHQLLPQSIRWLAVARDAQKWQTSIDRAMSILALATYVGITGELGAEFAYNVSLDQKELISGQVKASTTPTDNSKRVPLGNIVTAGKTSLFSVEREFTKTGRLYYTLDLRYMTPAAAIDAVNRGFAVSHQYTLLGAPGTPITRARLGDVIRVTLTVIAQHDRNYVTVEDMLPAGFEAIDPQLATTDPALRAQLEKERIASYTRSGDKFIAPWYRWYYSPWQQVDTRDDRTILKADQLSKGMYEYTYYARATTTGDFFVAPAHAEEQFFPEVFGHSDSGRFTITAP
jgi:alpha-2-macroglobulin